MSQDLLASLEYIEKEKGITKEVLLDALRHALISACRKGSPEKGDAFDVQIDPKTFRITMFLDGKEINDPRFDLRTSYEFGNGFIGWFGVDRVLKDNAITFGVGIRR